MSSAPCGLDVREYLYGSFDLNLTLAGTYVISAGGVWLVTRAQLFTAGTIGHVDGPNFGDTIDVVPNSCWGIEPNGAYRDFFRVSGLGGRFSAEFWFQARATVGQSIAIYVTDPTLLKTTIERPKVSPL